jgi:hypothetical protein
VRLTINPYWCRAVWSGTPLARWSDHHPASGLRPGDSLVFVWPQPWGSAPHRMSLKHYGTPVGPDRLEPWAVASLLGEAQDAIAERLCNEPPQTALGPEPATS